MYNDSFKGRYTTIPFATYEGNYEAAEHRKNTLSHCHREQELLLMLDGEAVFHIDGRDYIAQAGDVLAISPYRVHSVSFVMGKPCRHVCLCFDLSLLHDHALCHALEEGSAVIAPYVGASHPAAKPISRYHK